LQQDTVVQILLLSGIINGPFCSGHFNPFKSFFVLWIWTVTITRRRPDVKTLLVFECLKGTFLTFWVGKMIIKWHLYSKIKNFFTVLGVEMLYFILSLLHYN
jgi:hypothetical protein